MAKTTATPEQKTAAEEVTNATDAVAAQITATQEELTAALAVSEELAHQLESAKATIADRDASMSILATTNTDLVAKVASLEGQLEAAAEATVHRELPGDDVLHERWIAAGGTHAQFESAKRFAQQFV